MISAFNFSLRLRDMITGGGVPMLNLADHLGGRGKEWHKTIYLQIITGSFFVHLRTNV